MKGVFSSICLFVALFVFQVFEVNGQVYPFTYQGSLKDGNFPANGNYDIKFDIFNVPTGGVSQGGANFLQVPVVNGIFSLEFGGGTTSFFVPGSSYWVELSVRPSSSTGPHTLLTPRQKITYVPYSIASMVSGDALKLGGTPASQYVVTTDPRLSDERTPAAGSSNYIQNGTSAQASSNFNISGTGTANVLNAATQFNIGGSRVLSVAGGSFAQNLFAGLGTGNANTTGFYNAFFGHSAGVLNTSGSYNAFFGRNAGLGNTTGDNNAFFGQSAGSTNSTGDSNAFFGKDGGVSNTTGSFNSFFGRTSGNSNTTGGNNAFFGIDAGYGNTTGSGNSFFGQASGVSNTTGISNTIIGAGANVGSGNLTNATAIGANTAVTQSNSLVLGNFANVGIGTSAPNFKLHIVGGNMRLESLQFPSFSLNFAGGAVDAKKWQNYASTNNLVFSALNDAETFDTTWLRVNRGSGTAISSVVMPNGNVGVGTATPNAKLEVAGGSVYIQQPNSLIITSPNGACWFITVNNAGALATISVPCP